MEVISDGKDKIKKETTNESSNVKKVIAVMSGKGGVGKSTVTSLLGVSLKEQGYRVGVMDADVTGPSIPKLFGKNDSHAKANKKGIFPIKSDMGIKLMSINFLLENKDDPVIWRGPAAASVVKQFFNEVHWGELDYLLIDLPPGTGDIPLTMMQSIPLDGMVIVTSPQDLVNHIVVKSVNMAKKLDINIYGLIENMSYYKCQKCDSKEYVFGKSNSKDVASDMGINFISEIPIDPAMVDLVDKGKIEFYLRNTPEFGQNFQSEVLDTL